MTWQRIKARLRRAAFRQLAHSQRCWAEAYDLEKQHAAGSIPHRYALIGAYVYLIRAELLGLDRRNAEWWRAYLNRYCDRTLGPL